MNVAQSLVVLAGLVGALGTGCVARVHTRAYVADRHVVWVEPPPLVYVDGVYVVQDSDVGVYYVDGYYWYERHGVWYRRTYYNDPWVTVSVGFVPVHVVHRTHHHYAHYHGDGHVYREPARPSKSAHHKSAKPKSGASGSASGSASVSKGKRRTVESNGVDRGGARGDAGSREGGRRSSAPDSRRKSPSNERGDERVDRAPQNRRANIGDEKGGPSDSRERLPPSANADRGSKADGGRGSRADGPTQAPDQGPATNVKKKPKAKPRTKKPRR